ncbi:MAG: hypothetical protein QW666_00630 [Candidatus Woesearchaeota archaeon]
MNNPLFLSQLKPALKLCWKNRVLVALCGLIDIIFFFALMLIHYHVLKRIVGLVQSLMEEVQSTLAGAIAQQDITQLKPALMKSAEFMTAYHQIIKHAVIFLIAIFLAWIIFKSMNWYLANRIVKGKISFKSYAKYFAIYSLLWFAGLMIILCILMWMLSYAASTVLPIISHTGARIIAAILTLTLAYFAFISFSLIPKVKFKEVFIKGIKQWKQITPAYLLLIIITFLAGYIPLKISLWQNPAAYWLVLAFVLFISIPALSYGRIYISLVVNKA